MSVQIWLSQLKNQSEQSPSKKLSSELAEQFDLRLGDQVSSLQNDLHDSNIDIDTVVDDADIFEGEWPGFVELSKSYLRFCRNVNPQDDVQSFDLYAQFLTDLTTAFANNKGAVLEATVVSTGKIVVSMCLAQDAVHSPDQMLRTSYISSLLLKLFNSIRGEKYDPNAEDGPVKKEIIMYVATALCRVYFKLGTPSSCANVFSNIHTANIKFSRYSRAERVEYRYYLGRFYLMKNQLTLAYKHLNWAFDNCLTKSSNKRLILIYIVPAALLLGKLPSLALLSHFNLDSLYGTMVYALKSANYELFMGSIEEQRLSLWNRGLYILFKTRSIVILHRQILFKVWKIWNESTLPFGAISQAMKLSKGENSDNWHKADIDFTQLESILASLISQNMVKANVYSRSKVIRLRQNSPIPALSQVHNLDDSSLSGHEQWMDS